MFPQIFGKYVLERELASGGMARVYLATLRGAVGFEKRLVVKQIRPELSLDEAFVRRFVEEAKIAVELSHPNIVPVYELGVELGIYYMAMELCEGLTLTEILLETGPLDAAEGAHVGVEICRALDYAHRRGNIVHRDVTPRNVLLDEEGAIRLIDFGIAAPVTGAGSRERIEVFGSPGHMPPEQIRGEPPSPATDVFAVAALLVEAWTGRPPFRRGSFEASAAALAEPRAPLEHDHPELAPVAPIIAQALALRPEERPQDAEQLARRLRDFSRQFDSGDVAKRLGERVRRARRHSHAAGPWLLGDSSGPLTPAASPRALLSSRPSGERLGTPSTPRMPRTPATPPQPSTPAGSAPITRTFAARGDLVEWTRKIGSLPPPPDEAAADPDRTPPPSVPPPGEEPSTHALPVPGKRPPRARRLLWTVLAAVGLVLGAVVLLVRSPPPAPAPAPGEPAAQPRAPIAAPPAATSLGAGVAPSSAEPAPLPSPSPPRAPARVASAGPALLAPSAASSAVASGTLKLTADPPATVTISGGRSAQTLSTPVRAISLPAGRYSLTFRSATFGEPVVARVELASGATRSVHADFRAAIPTVVVR